MGPGGIVSPDGQDWLDLSNVTTDIIPEANLAGNLDIGKEDRPFNNLYVNEVHATELHGNIDGSYITGNISGNVQFDGFPVFPGILLECGGDDFPAISFVDDQTVGIQLDCATHDLVVNRANFVPLEDGVRSLGTESRHWKTLFVDEIELGPGGIVSPDGQDWLDLSNVTTDIIPEANLAGNLDVGKPDRPFNNLYVNELHGNLDAAYLTGAFEGNLELEGHIVCEGVMATCSDPTAPILPAYTFDGQTDAGLYLSCVDGSLGLAHGGVPKLGIADDLALHAHVLPTANVAYDLGAPDKLMRSVYTDYLYAARADANVLVGVLEGNVQFDGSLTTPGVYAEDGDASYPAYAWASDATSGMWRTPGGAVALSVGGGTTQITLDDATASIEAKVRLPSGLLEYVDDAAAATGGVAVGELYRSGSHVMIRVE